jgi:hypothetical protein
MMVKQGIEKAGNPITVERFETKKSISEIADIVIQRDDGQSSIA